MKYRPLPKRRNPMATVVRKLRPKRIASAKAYRRHDKHKHALRNRRDYQNPGDFLILTFFLHGGPFHVRPPQAHVLPSQPHPWP